MPTNHHERQVVLHKAVREDYSLAGVTGELVRPGLRWVIADVLDILGQGRGCPGCHGALETRAVVFDEVPPVVGEEQRALIASRMTHFEHRYFTKF